jgi:MFS family permease
MCFAGLTANFCTALNWGLLVIWAKHVVGLDATKAAALTATFTACKAVTMVVVGPLSDRIKRRRCFIVVGLFVAGLGVALICAGAMAQIGDMTADAGAAGRPRASLGGEGHVVVSHVVGMLLAGCALMGVGLGTCYPILTAAVADHTPPRARASAIGVYKFHRDSGYAWGALVTAAVTDIVSAGANVRRDGNGTAAAAAVAAMGNASQSSGTSSGRTSSGRTSGEELLTANTAFVWAVATTSAMAFLASLLVFCLYRDRHENKDGWVDGGGGGGSGGGGSGGGSGGGGGGIGMGGSRGNDSDSDHRSLVGASNEAEGAERSAEMMTRIDLSNDAEGREGGGGRA